jgi:hypothetical protein
LLYGKNLLIPQEFHSNLSAKNRAAYDFLTNWKTKVDSVIFALQKAQARDIKYANLYGLHVEYAIGEDVLLKIKNYALQASLGAF